MSGELAHHVWWERVKRAAEDKGRPGQRVMANWSHDMIEVLAAEEGRLERARPLGQRGWEPIPPERCTEQYKQSETRRLTDELGTTLGVGPMP